jgi:adenosylcobinamide-GDP ribazoletransferase
VIVGGGAALVFLLLQHILPLSASVLCAIIFAAFLLTSGFHEDGLADTFDGFGGGWTKERTLEIMRDSRIGVYGTLALIFLILGKFNFLSFLPQGQVWRWLIVAHTSARWTILPVRVFAIRASRRPRQTGGKEVGALEIITGTATLFLVLLLICAYRKYHPAFK